VEAVANSEDPQLALVASEPVEAVSAVDLADEAVAVAASAVIEVVSEVDSVAEAADEVTLVVVVEESDTSPTATDLPMVRPQVPAVHEEVALAAIEEAAVDSEATEEEVVDDMKTDAVAAAAAAAASTVDPAALTMNRSAVEIDIATATVVGTVEAETMARGSAATKATATTIGASAADTRPTRWLRFVKRLHPFSCLTTLSRH
jgi:hypothetical protein